MMVARRDGIAEILSTGQFPGTIIRGTTKGNHANLHVDAAHAAPNYSHGRMSPAERERQDARQWREKARAAEATKRARRGTKRSDDEVRPSGHIPLGVFQAMRAKEGADYWTTDTKEKMRRHGLAFDN